MNTQLRDQLKKAISENKLKIKYPKGYKQWKQKFDYFYNITKSVQQTLSIIYGPNGSVDNYQGSLYNNTNFNIKNIKKRYKKKSNKTKRQSSIFNYLKVKRDGNK